MDKKTCVPLFLVADPERFRFARETSFGRRHLHFWRNSPILLWIVCFFRQFYASVERVDYLTLRHGFVMAHLAPQQEKKFDFQLYINRALEEDFTDVVGIRLVFILLATIHTLNCTITMEPVTLTSQPMDNNVTNAIFALLGSISQDLAMINERLERRVGQREQVGCPETRQEEGRSSYVILPKVEALKSFFCDTLGIVRSHEKKTLVVGTQALVDPLDNEIAFSRENDLCPSSASTYNLTKWKFHLPSCFHKNAADIAISLSMWALIQFLCSYVTLPLYALVTQMGSTMKPVIFGDNVASAIRTWHQTAKQRANNGRPSENMSPFTSRAATPLGWRFLSSPPKTWSISSC
ncbi:hypothetical protein FXO38_24082 [Capsicum annuum]|nr:hypothetical protein FXO38_24082 [Capsicum annuum]